MDEETERTADIIREKTPIVDSFTEFTGIETTENGEVEEFRDFAVETATELVGPFLDNGLVSAETAGDAVNGWRNMIALNEDQLRAYGSFRTAVYQIAVEEMEKRDPDGRDSDIQSRIKKARHIIEINAEDVSRGIAFTCKPDAFSQRAAEEAGMPGKWIVVNWDKLQKSSDQAYAARATIYEETAHMIDQLSQYGISEKWVSEMMARVVVFGFSSVFEKGSSGYQQASEMLQAGDYMRLYSGIGKLIGDNEVLLRMFFGIEPEDSPAVEEAANAIRNMSYFGEMVDAGVPLRKVREHLEQVVKS